MIGIVNLSTLVSPSQAVLMVDACARQMREHFAPAVVTYEGVRFAGWSRLPTTPTLFASVEAVPRGLPILVLLDDSDDPGALGYHTEDGAGRVTGIVAAKPVLDEGGDVLSGPLSVASVLSHEVLETAVDPWAGGWEDAPDGTSWAREVADWVQANSYPIGGVSVSNFVLPQAFNRSPPSGSRFDYLGILSAPFSRAPGGYAVVRSRSGVVSQLGTRPAWKRSTRGAQRMGP